MREYQTEHDVALVTWSSFRNFIRDFEHGTSITTESYYSLGLSCGLLLGSRSPRRDEKRFLPKSIPRQNGAGYPLSGEKEDEEEVKGGSGMAGSLVSSTRASISRPPQTNGLMTCQVIFQNLLD